MISNVKKTAQQEYCVPRSPIYFPSSNFETEVVLYAWRSLGEI